MQYSHKLSVGGNRLDVEMAYIGKVSPIPTDDCACTPVPISYNNKLGAVFGNLEYYEMCYAINDQLTKCSCLTLTFTYAKCSSKLQEQEAILRSYESTCLWFNMTS